MNELLQINHQLRAEMAPSIEKLKKTVIESMESLRADFERQSKLFMLAQQQAKNEESQPQQQMDHEQELQQLEALPPANIAAITERMKDIAVTSHKVAMRLYFMRTLRFDGMELRRLQVPEAHKRTYSWAYMSDFSDWMVVEDPLFWISGKPGSGKSTLMKHLVNSPGTSAHLRKWAGTRKLVIIDYFFWINGTDLHRSQQGLLQSLLFDIFRKCPELIETAFPERWHESMNIGGFNEYMISWSRQELFNGLQRITQQTALSTAFCIFIDGLDEYEGEHEDLVNILSNIAHTSPIKLCVASRPWNVFEKTLGTNKTRKLYLENLNRPDIELYVKNHLQDRTDFQALALYSRDAIGLVSDIVERSNGVFLWVYLVVLLVKQGLVNEDRLVDLKRRVNAYPADLNTFFKHIMDSLDPFYQAQIARGFSVMLAARQPLSVVSFWFLDELELDPNIAIAKKVDNESEKNKRLESFWKEEIRKMTTRLNGRFKGLLEIVWTHQWASPSEIKVEFLHRTVRDFLVTEDCQRVLKKWTPPSFDIHFAICNIILAEVKELHTQTSSSTVSKRLAETIFYSAQKVKECHQRSLNNILEHFERTIASYGDFMSPWNLLKTKSFLTYAVMTNLTGYISNRLKTNTITEQERLDCLQNIFSTARHYSADDLHGLPFQVEVVGKPLEMILILVETRPLEGNISFHVVLAGLELYQSATVLGILRCLCKNGLVELEDFRYLASQVRSLTTSWDTKELEELTRTARNKTPGPGISQKQVGLTKRPNTRPPHTRTSKERGRLKRWIEKLKSG